MDIQRAKIEYMSMENDKMENQRSRALELVKQRDVKIADLEYSLRMAISLLCEGNAYLKQSEFANYIARCDGFITNLTDEKSFEHLVNSFREEVNGKIESARNNGVQSNINQLDSKVVNMGSSNGNQPPAPANPM